ncbi:hypothetical protein BOTBODRAFT_28186 [Botryobasidium botryosum FD-172 SS1]|uniref:Uncharacterized protein n=1 Tax=Botryobasidium botryosum (strain FD-172 SS1) TaxID=930990 RepID=A0A067N750_BOTB1|nr:hypothetical protein BOTBODRAFT_28186 [Botryobasidium botryosum FD-172 SS1]
MARDLRCSTSDGSIKTPPRTPKLLVSHEPRKPHLIKGTICPQPPVRHFGPGKPRFSLNQIFSFPFLPPD